ncbi:perlucin-like protein [Ruditapes philippinarum]|uniref:perlucin-like protein n=1 Tax=Ruditapes philippinarum TaxID=129788 RepID=UPI00295BC02E|nr:perlucin-like protein [Ruditapes philippinarum]XP_060574337.1 perlucin-like protein [Ruditapes philippinarum]
MISVSWILVFGYFTCTKSLCLNETEYEFYMISNLVKDVGERIQSLRENVKEVVEAKCPKLTCPHSSCDDDWVSYNGSCYLFEATETRNFEDARIFCKQKASVILYVQDEAENSFIVRTLSRFKSTIDWFMGLNDKRFEGNWKWTDTNAPANFIKWAPGQPDGITRQNCVVYHVKNNNRWHDTECESKCSVICKKNNKRIN